MDQNRIKRNQMLGAKIVKELTARNMEAYYTDSKEEALKKALELIPEGSSISWGGSMSVNEIGLKEAVCQGNYQVYNRDTAPTPEDKRKIELPLEIKSFGSFRAILKFYSGISCECFVEVVEG